MNIEKVKSYNQKVLAGLGTLVVLFGIVGLIAVAHEVIEDIKRDRYYENEVKGILSDEEIEELQKKFQRQQLVNYKEFILLDTVQHLYMIPVGQKDLKNPEASEYGLLGLLDIESSYEYELQDGRYTGSHYGDYNNLLIYDEKGNTQKKLFDFRVNFTMIKIKRFEDDILLLMNIASKDTHKDGVVNLNDLNDLFIYSLKEDRLRKVSLEGSDLLNYDFIPDSKDLLIRYGVDYDKSGFYTANIEPSVIMKYDYLNEDLSAVVDDKLHGELQKMLEGL